MLAVQQLVNATTKRLRSRSRKDRILQNRRKLPKISANSLLNRNLIRSLSLLLAQTILTSSKSVQLLTLWINNPLSQNPWQTSIDSLPLLMSLTIQLSRPLLLPTRLNLTLSPNWVAKAFAINHVLLQQLPSATSSNNLARLFWSLMTITTMLCILRP